MTIKENITTINKWHDRGGYSVQGIVIHSMWGYYAGSISWFKNKNAKASCHYCIKGDGEITMCVEESAAAWHAGNVTTTKEKAPGLLKNNWGVNPNLITIGIEMEDKKNSIYRYPEIQHIACVELVADICKRYGIDANRDNIIMHKEVDPIGRSDPVGYWDHDKFVSDVQVYILRGGETKAFEPLIGVTVDIPAGFSLNVRSDPARTTKNIIKGLDGEIKNLKVMGYVRGEDVTDQKRDENDKEFMPANKFWYQIDLGRNRWGKPLSPGYIWAGGTSKPDPESYKIKNEDILSGINKLIEKEKTMSKEELELERESLTALKSEVEAKIEANRVALEEVSKVVEVVAEPVITEEAPAMDDKDKKIAELESEIKRLKENQ